MRFVSVARVDDMPDNSMRMVEVADRLVLLIRQGGEFYCLDDVCTHDGGTLSDGRLDEHAVICPRHGARFDIRTGAALTMPATEDTMTYTVRVVGQDVQVGLPDDS
jgi:3-phenylpropionate/trans-cinnamate dioxygenase ferredoxin subunit